MVVAEVRIEWHEVSGSKLNSTKTVPFVGFPIPFSYGSVGAG